MGGGRREAGMDGGISPLPTMSKRRRLRHAGFTMIEMVVVLVI
ncbi:MAG: prepilin-type N-terminal cleavage/methylation domain-containing protein, partial [Chthoniobacterales bacterium]